MVLGFGCSGPWMRHNLLVKNTFNLHRVRRKLGRAKYTETRWKKTKCELKQRSKPKHIKENRENLKKTGWKKLRSTEQTFWQPSKVCSLAHCQSESGAADWRRGTGVAQQECFAGVCPPQKPRSQLHLQGEAETHRSKLDPVTQGLVECTFE